ncbi:porin family protein [Membranihabitans maritimus]|uniref:porin family protein n=1 Tax=Membranihabitans maritimus TaxID=2904244 RepID=UPI001F4763F4|nr:porin family protein [Membranihabitans maritimus]
MKNWKAILIICSAILCFGINFSIAQSTDSDSLSTEIQDKIEKKNKEIKKIKDKIKVLKEKAEEIDNKEAREEIEDVVEDLEEEIEDLKEEIEELNEEDLENEVETIVENALEGLDISFKKKDKPLKNVKTRWFLVDLGFASYLSENTLPEIGGINPMEPDIINSVSWRLHVVRQRINLINHNVNLMYGAGFTFNYYGFSNPATLEPFEPNVTYTLEESDSYSYKKNHLRTTYLHIPVMLNFESNPRKKSKSFHLNAGVYGNVLMGAKTVQRTNNVKIKTKDKFNLNNFQYGLIGSIGYGPITFYGTMGLNELFKPEKSSGYDVTPITFGLSILPF